VTDRDLLRHIARSPQQRAGYKQLVCELGLGGGRERRLLLEHLARLTFAGELVKLDREQWQIPRAAAEAREKDDQRSAIKQHAQVSRSLQDAISGKLDLHRDGYGFVRPANAKGRDDDIFIPPPALGGAMQGDIVMVEVDRGSRDGRKSGRVLRVLTRRNPTVVGIFHYGSERKSGRRRRPANVDRGWQRTEADSRDSRFVIPPGFHWLQPYDERMTQPVLIALGDEIPRTENAEVGGGFSLRNKSAEKGGALAPEARQSPHRTLGIPQREWSNEDIEGLAVDVEITDFPTMTRPARGRVIEILGDAEDFGVDVEIIIRKHHLPHIFPDTVLEEARHASPMAIAVTEDRRDFRDLPIVTIDGESARDFDDAVLVRALPGGVTELQVHIADVSHYVTPGSALDLEARLRGTSVYFPDRAVPMLPHELSSGACSLRPDEDRYVLSAILRFDHEGNRIGYELTKGVIRSAARMTYRQVHAILEGDAAVREQFAALVPEFERMHSFARVLNRQRQQRGSIDFDLPEPQIEFDEQGQMRGIIRSERNWAHRLIEEFMLAANECVASHLEQAGAVALYRIHEKPDPAKIMEFEDAAAVFGHSLGVGNLAVKRFAMKADRREQQRRGERGRQTHKPRAHEVPQEIAVSPKMYQRLAEKISGKPEERILSYLMLRSLKQARYSAENEGHFALAADSYTHFTSPIRRYPDLIVHRALSALLAKNPIRGVIPTEASVGGGVEEPAFAFGVALASEIGPGFSPDNKRTKKKGVSAPGTSTLSAEEAAAIATESSEAERRADAAERELIEWKKVRFMQDRIGEEFDAIVLSVTKFGMFVELNDMFLEGLVPLESLRDLGEVFFYRENTRQLAGEDSGRKFAIGDRVRVALDKILRMERRLIFAVVDERVPAVISRKKKQQRKRRQQK
jgi:ribonuclease R